MEEYKDSFNMLVGTTNKDIDFYNQQPSESLVSLPVTGLVPLATLYIMILAIINGLITSILLETIILLRQVKFKEAFKTALGMSFISMLTMEIGELCTQMLMINI